FRATGSVYCRARLRRARHLPPTPRLCEAALDRDPQPEPTGVRRGRQATGRRGVRATGQTPAREGSTVLTAQRVNTEDIVDHVAMTGSGAPTAGRMAEGFVRSQATRKPMAPAPAASQPLAVTKPMSSGRRPDAS